MRRNYIQIIKTTLLLTLLVIGLTNCGREGELVLEDPNRELELLKKKETATDKWIKTNLTDVYNIDAIWRWDYAETGYSKNFIPPREDNVIPFLSVVNHTFLQGYVEHVSKEQFLPYVPKQLLLLGEWGYNTNGTITLGQAEAGQKIVFYGVDHWDADAEYGYPNMREAVHTMFHEYGHVLHQNKVFSEEFQKITPEGYTSTWNNESELKSRVEGFASSYSRLNQNEDFVELIAFYTTLSDKDWNAHINQGVDFAAEVRKRYDEKTLPQMSYYKRTALAAITGKGNESNIAKNITDSDITLMTDKALKGRANINRKMLMVKEYLITQWNINIDELREIVLRRSTEVFNNTDIFPQAGTSSPMKTGLRSAEVPASKVESPFVHNCRFCGEHGHKHAPKNTTDPKTEN